MPTPKQLTPNIAQNVVELIGNTPLLQFNAYAAKRDIPANIIGKLEYFNPAGSVKDRIGYSLIVYIAAMQGISESLYEAAKIDGAGHVRIFSQILMPLTKSALISLAMLSFISCWNEYMTPLIFLVKKTLYTISQVIRWYMLDDLQRYDLNMAAATSAIIPVVILFIFCQKYFVEGIATSGVKG